MTYTGSFVHWAAAVEGLRAPDAGRHARERAGQTCIEDFVRWCVADERRLANVWLPVGLRHDFLRYYENLPAAGDETGIRRHARGLWNTETGWVMRRLAKIAAREARAPRVLDAGCGYGSFAMMFALAGAEVTGVDLRNDRLEVAATRLDLHRVHRGVELPIRYLCADLTQQVTGTYDVVWVYNAISHIDPIEPFLRAAARHLRPDGVLVIGDINGGNPEHLARLDGKRDEIHQSYTDAYGRRHRYAVERPFTPVELRAAIEAEGMRIVRHELLYGGNARLHALPAASLRPLQRCWWVPPRFARRQCVVATRSAGNPV